MPQANSMFSRPRANFADGIGQGLAVFERDEFRDAVTIGVKDLTQSEHDFGAARERRCAPVREGFAARWRPRVNIGSACEFDASLGFSGCRIPDNTGPA